MRFFRSVWLASAYAAMVIIYCAASTTLVRGQAADPALLDGISSQRYIVIDADTGEVFAEQGGTVRAGMASVTKIFTALVALERAPLDMEILANESDVFDQTSTLMPGFAPGITYTVRDLLYGMILNSGNDAAHALARGVAMQPGDSDDAAVNRFVQWMNDKAAQLGLLDTHFANPHGLGDPEHYSSPRDLAVFMMNAIQNQNFMAIVSAQEYVATTGDVMRSINRSPQFVPDHVGGKTGYDDTTGYCLAELQERGDARLITVTFDGVAPDIWYMDHAILMDYGYAALQDRIASGNPIGETLVAAAQQAGSGQADAAPTAIPEIAFESTDTGPRPVLVSGRSQPTSTEDDDNAGVFDNWLIGFTVLAIVIHALWMQLRPGARRRIAGSETTEEIDT